MTAEQTTAIDPSDDYLARAESIASIIADGAAEGERERQLTGAVMDALHGAGLFRLLLPASYGGGEVDPPTYARIIEAVAKADASAAWCLGQANGCTITAAYVEPAVAEEIWGNDPRAVLAWGPGKGELRADGDGYRLTGSWSFASGCHHATWLGAVSVVKDADGPNPRVLATLAVGDFFGETALMERQPRNATVRALEDTECVAVWRVDFRSEVKRHPEIAVKMLSVLFRRLSDAAQPSS